MADWRVGAARDLPIAQTDRAWDGDAARRRIFEWAGWPDSPDPARARRAFLAYDAERAEEKGAYKLPFADIVDGELRAIPSGLRAAASRLPQADLPAEVKARARQVLDAYFERLRKSAKAGPLRVKVKLPDGAEVVAPVGERTKRLKSWDALRDPGHLVLGMPFGGPHDGRDADGEAFHEGTDAWLRIGDEVPVTYYHGFGPDAPGEWQERPAVIGLAKLTRVDERGYWFRVRYDPDEPLAQRVMSAPLDALRASSGAVAHLARVRPDGLIDTWPVGELAVFDVNDWRQPANDWAVVVPAEAEAEATAKAQDGAEADAVPEAEAGEQTETVKSQSQTEGNTVAEKTETQAPEQVAVQTEMDIQAVIERAVQAAAEAAAAKAMQAVAAEPPVNTGAAVAQKRVMVARHDERVMGLTEALNKARKTKAPVYLPLTEGAMKALSEGTDTAGGYLVAPEYARQVIDMLSAQAVVRRAGATVIPMGSDTLNIPAVTGGATGYWVAENAAITASDQAFGQVQLTAKKLAALTKISAELIEDSDPSVQELVARDLARALALAEDLAYLRGDGASNNPVGIRNTPGVTVTELGTGDGATPSFDDLLGAIYALDAANAPSNGRAWIVHPRTVQTLRQLKDSNGNYIWADPAAPGDPPTIWGYPVYTTTQIPINLTVGTSANASEIYFGAFGEAIIGQRKALELRASDEAGNAFEYDQVFIRAIMRVDFAVRHAASFAVLTGVLP